jgi:hypothetical protein
LVAVAEKVAEVRRLLERYLVEVVEEYGLCPWARQARLGGEVGVHVLWGQPSLDDWSGAASQLLMRPSVRAAMIVAPELALTTDEFRGVREQVARTVTSAGVAEFHPDGHRDTGNPARLVPLLRRSPDPLMQLVPFKILQSVRSSAALEDLQAQAAMLGGISNAPREDIGDRIAETNHGRVTKDLARFEKVLEDISDDRRRSYARVGIAINTSR